MDEIYFKIIKELGVISENNPRGMKRKLKKEINIVSWYNRKPKLDIREWSEDHEFVGRGVTLSAEELKILSELLQEKEKEINSILDSVSSSLK